LLHVGYKSGVAGSNDRAARSVPIAPAGAEGPEETIIAADADIGLFTAADGTVHGVSAEIPFDGRGSGIYQYGRAASGAWGALGQVTGYSSSYASRPSGLDLGAGGLLTLSPMAGVARVFRGATGAGEGTQVPVPESCYGTSPAMARDSATGAVFVAWVQWDCPQVGVFVAQFDPATGAFGPPVQAPGSSWTVNGDARYPDVSLDEDLAFTGRPGQPGVFLAYFAGPKGNVMLWRVGAPGATTFTAKKTGARNVRIAADGAGGRVWVAWREDDRLWIQRTTSDGTTADGAARPAAVAPNPAKDALRLYDYEIAARGGALDILLGYHRGDTPGALYRARITP
jgi:hypothetical protein